MTECDVCGRNGLVAGWIEDLHGTHSLEALCPDCWGAVGDFLEERRDELEEIRSLQARPRGRAPVMSFTIDGLGMAEIRAAYEAAVGKPLDEHAFDWPIQVQQACPGVVDAAVRGFQRRLLAEAVMDKRRPEDIDPHEWATMDEDSRNEYM